MGVVQQDGELFADGHKLHTSLHHALAQTVVDGGIRQTQHLAHSQCGQRVVHAELAGHIHLDVHLVLAGNVEGNAQKIVGAQQFVAGLAVVGLFIAAIGDQLAGVAFQQGGGVLVVDIHHAHIAALEQLSLPAAVLLKGLVLAGADVIRRKVGEHAHIVVHARHAVHHQALTGYLHQRGIAAGIQKLPEGLLQLVAFRGSVGGVLVASHIVDAVGADHAHLAACGLQHAFDHVGGSGLALGAGDADHGHLAGRVAEEVGAHQRHGIAAALHLDHGHPGQGRKVDIVLDDQRADPLGGAVGGKRVAVPLGAHDAHEQKPRGSLAAVVDDIRDLSIQTALHKGKGHAFHQLFQLHTVSSKELLYMGFSSSLAVMRSGWVRGSCSVSVSAAGSVVSAVSVLSALSVLSAASSAGAGSSALGGTT